MEAGIRLEKWTNWEAEISFSQWPWEWSMLSADVISPSLRCCCSASQQAWHRLTHGHLSYGAIQWPGCSWPSLFVSLSFSHFCSVSLDPSPVFLFFFFFRFCLSHSRSHRIAYTSSPTFLLASFLVSLSPPVSHLHSATSLSHTLVATLKTEVAMVTTMCCGNVKELNPPRITSLFNT